MTHIYIEKNETRKVLKNKLKRKKCLILGNTNLEEFEAQVEGRFVVRKVVQLE